MNGTSTDVALKSLDSWLATGAPGKKWDLIHFNWGLHDLKHWKDGKLDLAGPQVNDLATYERNLREIVPRLKKTGAKLIFATTTPVPEGSPGRVADDELMYNSFRHRNPLPRCQSVLLDFRPPTEDNRCIALLGLCQMGMSGHFHGLGNLNRQPTRSAR